jgi:hypothetical protein
MADILISNLPLYTGDTNGSYLVMNDSGETTTYKVTKQTFIDTAVASYSWTTNYTNLTNGAENYARWDTEVFNSNPNIFELVNSAAAGNTGARIFLKEPGYYELISQVHLFDAFGNQDLLVKYNSATGSSSTAMSVGSLISDEKFAESTGDRLINGTICFFISTPTYITLSINPSANSPYPSDANSTPTRIFVKKLL